jgi:DNA-binding CsgD family transcriptional regulator
MVEAVAQTPLERESVLAGLAGLARQAARGAGKIALLHGEAGVGKSVVVASFMSSVATGARVLLGNCDPLVVPRRLGPLIDMLPQLPGAQSAGLRAAIEAGEGESIYVRLLDLFGDGNPWICVIEDAHWADGATLDLLRFFARRIESLPVLVAVTYRDDELGPQHPLTVALGDMANHPSLTRIRLSPLGVDSVRRLASGSGVNAEQLHRITGGNPFLLTEVLAAGADGAGVTVPRGVADAVRGRLARLSGTGRQAVEATAVCGPLVDPRFLEKLRPTVLAGLSECVRAGLLVADGDSVRFRHELTRRATLEQIPHYDRRVMHRLALDALAEPPIDPDALASLVFHAEQAGDGSAVVRYGPAAAERAATSGAHCDAAELYALVLGHAGSTPDRHKARWLERHAFSCFSSGHVAAAAKSWRDAITLRHRLGDRLAEGDNLRRLSNMLAMLGDTAAAAEAAHESLGLLEPLGVTPQLGWSLVNVAQQTAYRDGDSTAKEYAARAGDVADHLGDASLRLPDRMYGALMTVSGTGEGWDQLETGWREAMSVGGTAELGGMSSAMICWTAAIHADVDRAERYLGDSIEFCRQKGLDFFEVLVAGAGARIDVYRGEWGRAVATAEDILTRPNLASLHRIWPLISLAIVRARRSQQPVMPLLDEALAAGEADDRFRIGSVWAARAEVAWLAGDDQTARAEVEKGLEVSRADRDPWLGGHLLRWAHLAGSPPTATVARPAAPYRLEIAGDWKAASDNWIRRGCPYDAAIAQLGGDIPAVETALRTFRHLGAHAAADKARQRLATLRGASVRPHRADTRSHPYGLTRREREILELLALGQSDACIANTLFISQRTVNNHVHAILGKLGVHNRTQAATFAYQQPHRPQR